LSSKEPGFKAGEILQVSPDGHVQKVLATGQALPDGIAVDPSSKRIFWTNMGIPGKDDGAVLSASLNGTDIQTVVAPGTINTPKQLALDVTSKKVYFCDREGLRVIRCNYDGSEFEILVQAGDPIDVVDSQDAMNWCVGITVAPRLGKFYWSQKGPSKGGQGRIFSANITTPQGQSMSTRDDIQVILSGLPEPIDLEIDEETRTLYWTDRGELPFGNSLNRLCLDHFGFPLPNTSRLGYEVLSRNLNEAIGLKLDLPKNSIYLTDLGGNLYRCDRDGKHRVKLLSDENRALTGLAFA
jgi:DNA-binding beta-propeller fold protein YncE